MRFRLGFILLLLVSVVLHGKAQDLHFSQAVIVPAYVNPSFVGRYNGGLKVSGIARTQWSSVTVPYNTFGFFFEGSEVDPRNSLSIGASFFRDVTGDSRFTTQAFSGIAAYKLLLNKQTALSFGFQLGIKNQTLDFSDLYFDNQYNGDRFDPNLPHNENRSYSPVTAPDAGFGFSYLVSSGDVQFAIGYGVQNLIKNNQSILSGSETLQKARNSIQAIADIDANGFLVSPAVYFSKQGKLSELLIGCVFSTELGDENNYIGASIFSRVGDAFIFGVLGGSGRLEYGLSYDFNYSALKEASSGKGATEVSLSYILTNSNNKNKRKGICPVYL